jgi:hypothetical protein
LRPAAVVRTFTHAQRLAMRELGIPLPLVHPCGVVDVPAFDPETGGWLLEMWGESMPSSLAAMRACRHCRAQERRLLRKYPDFARDYPNALLDTPRRRKPLAVAA